MVPAEFSLAERIDPPEPATAPAGVALTKGRRLAIPAVAPAWPVVLSACPATLNPSGARRLCIG